MVRLLITKQDLQFLILAAYNERHRSEEVGVPLCRSELACIAKLHRARDRAEGAGPEVTAEWEADLRGARSFEGMGEAFVERFRKSAEADTTKRDGSR